MARRTAHPGAGSGPAGEFVLPIDLPAGTELTAISARVLDGVEDEEYTLTFERWYDGLDEVKFESLRVANGGLLDGTDDVNLYPGSAVVVGAGESLAVRMATEAVTTSAGRNGLCSVTFASTLPAP